VQFQWGLLPLCGGGAEVGFVWPEEFRPQTREHPVIHQPVFRVGLPSCFRFAACCVLGFHWQGRGGGARHWQCVASRGGGYYVRIVFCFCNPSTYVIYQAVVCVVFSGMCTPKVAVVCNRVTMSVHILLAVVVGVLVGIGGIATDVAFELVEGSMREVSDTQADPALPQIQYGNSTFQPSVRATGVKLSLTALVMAFSLLSGLGQIYFSICAGAYTEFMEHNDSINWYRYVEYSISASVMLAVITLELGIRDWGALVGIVGCTWSCMIFGLLADILSKTKLRREYMGFGGLLIKKSHLIAHAAGWISIAFPFWVILGTFNSSKDTAPDFVTAIVVVETFLFVIFGLVQTYGFLIEELKEINKLYTIYACALIGEPSSYVVSTEQGKQKQLLYDILIRQKIERDKLLKLYALTPLRAEIAYLSLSLVSKVLLSVIVFSLALVQD